MVMNSKSYVVPFDFSPVAESALHHGILLARASEAKLIVLHLVSNESKIATKKHALSEILNRSDFQRGVDLIPMVLVGSIFEDINRIAMKYGSSRIIMGTHGALGMQKVFGSNAIKVVKSTNLPIYIVQDSRKWEDIKNIVVPIDTSKESMQIIAHAADIAYLFKAKVLVVAELQKDEDASKQMKTRIKIVEDKFQSLGIDAAIHLFDSSGSFSKKIIDYAQTNNAQLIATAYFSESLFAALDSFHQGIIMNEAKIPVLIIQSQEVSFSYY
jgi:nucleotide-binding universal stress UspA family protein